jgi:ABC-2 type transport system permease protein
VSQPGTLVWFARHELGLSWRDWLSLLTAGKRRRRPMIAIAIVILAIIAHLLAYAIIAPLARAGITPDKPTLAILTGGAFLSWSLMLSQAMESVTRAFYARADLDLILSSPAPARRIFAIRIGAIVFSTTLMAMALAVPFINILAIFDGPQWFAAYGVLFAMGAVSTALALAMTVGMFVAFGPKRTRLIAQIVAAVVGAGFVIGIQAAAILSYGSLSRITFLQSDVFLDLAPDPSSLFWWPARAAMGDVDALVAVMILSGVVLFGAIRTFSARFGYHVIAASSVAMGTARTARRTIGFRQASTRRVLRRKEWTLLRRDPWLVSQTLMQVLYLLPPALLLWRNFAADVGTLLIMVPVLVMAAGQLAGGLAWLAVSGEDAPDLVDSAPISAGSVILAKVEAVMAVIAIVTAPMLIALAFASVKLATVAALGIAASALSAILIQIWFRTQASRGAFRRRQTSSRIATFAEAFSSILWAGTAGLAVAGSRFAPVLAGVAICMLVFTWMIRPRSTDGA